MEEIIKVKKLPSLRRENIVSIATKRLAMAIPLGKIFMTEMERKVEESTVIVQVQKY